MENEKKVKMAAFRIAFLMPHQSVISDLESEIEELIPSNDFNKESDEYLAGARDALLYLIQMLKEKGPSI